MFAFSNSPALKEVSLPGNVEIAEYAFYNSGMEKISLRAMPTSVGVSAFFSESLRDFEVNSVQDPTFSPFSTVMMGVNANHYRVVAFVPYNMVKTYKENDEWNIFEDILPIGAKYQYYDEPYNPDNECYDLTELSGMAGYAVLSVYGKELQYTGTNMAGSFFWNGDRGLLITDISSDNISGSVWGEQFAIGDCLTGWIAGLKTRDYPLFRLAASEITSTKNETLEARTVTGEKLTANDRLLYGLVKMHGSVIGSNFTADDGTEFSMVDKLGEPFSMTENKDVFVQGIYLGNASGSNILFINDEEPVTGVDSIESVVPADDAIYNLQGIRVDSNVDKLPKGVYIKGGKKFVVK